MALDVRGKDGGKGGYLYCHMTASAALPPYVRKMYSAETGNIYEESLVSLRKGLVTALMRLVPESGRHLTAINGLMLTRWNDQDRADTCFYAPSIAVIVQGNKESLIGSQKLIYGAMDCLVNGVDMPSASRILEATPDKPLLAVSLNIDRVLATELAAQVPAGNNFTGHHYGVSIDKAAPDVLEAFSRLVDMLERPDQAPFRAPLLIREIITRVLVGPQGAALRMIYTRGSHGNQIARAITWLREHYTEALRIDDLAGLVGMSVSTLHHQFKKATSISPLQFHKRLRLYEAQRLMLTEGLDANTAGRGVGYDNIQQFNREYKRIFGEPPHRHIRILRKE